MAQPSSCPTTIPCAASGEVCGHGSLTVGSWAKQGQRTVFTKFLLDRCRNTLRSLNKFTWSFPVELLADVPRLCRLPCRSPTNTTKQENAEIQWQQCQHLPQPSPPQAAVCCPTFFALRPWVCHLCSNGVATQVTFNITFLNGSSWDVLFNLC